DHTFGEDIWVSQSALDDEASGFCLVPAGTLPEGWESVSEAEAGKVWGKGQTTASNKDRTKPCDKKAPGCAQNTPMAQYAFHVMLASLNIVDTPLGYTPPL